jgi:hypothetical protein
MSLVSPPSEPKLMTVPVPFGQQIRDVAQQTPANAVDRDVDLGARGGGAARSFQPATCVAITGDPGNVSTSFAALASLRTNRMTFTPRSVRTLPIRRPTADPAAVSSVTNRVRASGGRESCAAPITIRAVNVLISICAPISSGIGSGNGTTELARITASSLQAPGAGKRATLRPSRNPSAGSTLEPIPLTTPAP